MKTCSSADLRIRDVECPELLAKLSLIPKLCYLSGASKSDVGILSTSRLKTPFAINSFALNGPAFSPVALLLYELSFLKGSNESSASYSPPDRPGVVQTDVHGGAQARIQAHVNKCVKLTQTDACGDKKRTRPTSGVRDRRLLPAGELAPWSAGSSATDPHGVARARLQTHANEYVRCKTIYGCAVRKSQAPDLGHEILPLAAGSETRPIDGRSWDHRPALLGSCNNTSTRKRMRKTNSHICMCVGELRTPNLGRESSLLAASEGTRALVGRAWCDRPAWWGSGKNTGMHTGMRKRMREAYSNICVRRLGIAHVRPRA